MPTFDPTNPDDVAMVNAFFVALFAAAAWLFARAAAAGR